ncbi:MAG TPA: hypothetical protein VFT84_07630, partial [Gemmatimonadales bacterium]|nr:hypothetical protein [Gemmatimonadales bacterium]
MKTAVRAIGAATALMAAMATNAWAFGPFSNTQVCGGTLFTTCATLTTTYDATTDVLRIEISNTSSNGDAFTAIGIRGLPEGVTFTTTIDPALVADWEASADVNELGGDPDGANPKYTGFQT